jgi:hypothetical protein
MEWYHDGWERLQDGQHRKLFTSHLLFESLGRHVFQSGFYLCIVDQLAESCDVLDEYSWLARLYSIYGRRYLGILFSLTLLVATWPNST